MIGTRSSPVSDKIKVGVEILSTDVIGDCSEYAFIAFPTKGEPTVGDKSPSVNRTLKSLNVYSSGADDRLSPWRFANSFAA